jgi:hypothetical protein
MRFVMCSLMDFISREGEKQMRKRLMEIAADIFLARR